MEIGEFESSFRPELKLIPAEYFLLCENLRAWSRGVPTQRRESRVCGDPESGFQGKGEAHCFPGRDHPGLPVSWESPAPTPSAWEGLGLLTWGPLCTVGSRLRI